MKKSSNSSNTFPDVRLRRLRTTPAIRDLMQETRLSAKDLIAPMFVQEGLKKPGEIGSMPDIQRLLEAQRFSVTVYGSAFPPPLDVLKVVVATKT